MKHRFWTAGLLLALSVSLLGGCGSSKSAEEKTTEAKTETTNTVDYSKGLNEDGTLAGVEKGAYVTLCDYEAIRIPESEVAVGKSEVQAEIDTILQSYQTEKQVKDRKVKDGDVVNIDFVGSIDGKEFDGGSAQGTNLTIGSGTFIDDFEEQLVGHKPGDKVKVEVTFPEDYGKEELNGKEAVFETTINYISEKTTPELTDDFVKENLSENYGYTTVKQMKKDIKENLQNNKKYTYIWDYIVDNSKYEEIPKELVEPQLDLMVESLKASLATQNATLDDYLAGSGYKNEAELREAYYDNCVDMVKSYLVADAVAAEKSLSVQEDDMKEYFKKYYGSEDYSSYVEYYGKPYINRTVLNNMVTELLVKSSKTVK